VEGEGEEEEKEEEQKIFSSGNLMSCPELYSQVKSDNKCFWFGRNFRSQEPIF
jgi:hypothetical protein